MKAVEYSFLTPEVMGKDYRRACRTVGLKATASGYGLLYCIDEAGKHWTRITEDIEYHHVVVARLTKPLPLTMPETEKYDRMREGWPDEWLHWRGQLRKWLKLKW